MAGIKETQEALEAIATRRTVVGIALGLRKHSFRGTQTQPQQHQQKKLNHVHTTSNQMSFLQLCGRVSQLTLPVQPEQLDLLKQLLDQSS